MTKEEAKKIISKAIEDHGVAKVSDDFIEGWNSGIGFLITGLKEYPDRIQDILVEPPVLSRFE